MSVHGVFRDRVATRFIKRLSINSHTFAYKNLYRYQGWKRVSVSEPDIEIIGKYMCGELRKDQAIAVLLNRLETNVLILDVDRKNGKSIEETREDYLRAIDAIGVFPSIVFRSRTTGFHAYWVLDRRVPTAYATDLLKQELARHGVRDIEVKPSHNENLTLPIIRRRADVETLATIPRGLRYAAIDLQRALAFRNRISADSILGGKLAKHEVFAASISAPEQAFNARQRTIESGTIREAGERAASFPPFSPGETQGVVLSMMAALRVQGFNPEERITAILEHARNSTDYSGDLTKERVVRDLVMWDDQNNSESSSVERGEESEPLPDTLPPYDPTHFIRDADFTQLVRRYVVDTAEILVKKWQMTNPKQRRSVINFICYLFYTEQYRRQEFANPVKAGFRQSANRLYAQNMSNGFIEYPAQSMKTVYSYYPDIITRLLREGLLEQKLRNSYSNIHHYAKTYRINHEHKTLEWTRKRDQNRAESYGGIELTYWERVLYEYLQNELGYYEMKKITNRDIVRDPQMKNAGFKAYRISKTLKSLKKTGLIDIFIRRQQHPGGMRTIRKIEVRMIEDVLEERARKARPRYGSLRAIYERKRIRKRFSTWAQQLLKRLDGEAAFEIEIGETGGRPKKDILVSDDTYRKAVDHYFLFMGDDVPEPQERSE